MQISSLGSTRSSIIKPKINRQKTLANPNKKEHTLEEIKLLLAKEKPNRTKMDKKIISDYLSLRVEFFSDLNNSKDATKLEKLMNVLNLETYSKGRTIISFGEEADKFYVLIEGTIGIYKPMYRLKLMTVKDYVKYMHSIQEDEMDLLKFDRVKEKNKLHLLDMKYLLSSMDCETEITRKELFFFIEEEEKLNEYGAIFPFGNIALIKRVKRNATIRSLEESHFVSINKEDYNKILREIEEKKLESDLRTFKLKYQLFSNWGLNQLLRLFNCFSKINLLKGEYLYRQNEDADCIYIVRSGMIDMYSLVSFAWVNEYFDYIIDAKNNLVHYISKHKGAFEEKELQQYYNKQIGNIQKSPCYFDPYKTSKIITSNDAPETFEKMKHDQEELNNPSTLFKVLIKKIKSYDVLGLEDSLEMKKRLCFAKCVSSTCEVDKINLYSFFKLLSTNRNEKNIECLINIIASKKAHIFQQILNSTKQKTKALGRSFEFRYVKAVENETKPNEETRFLSMDLKSPQFFDFEQFNEEMSKKISLVKRNKNPKQIIPSQKKKSLTQSSSTYKLSFTPIPTALPHTPKFFITNVPKKIHYSKHPVLYMRNTYSHFNLLTKSMKKTENTSMVQYSKDTSSHDYKISNCRLTSPLTQSRITPNKSLLSPQPLRYNGGLSAGPTRHKFMKKDNNFDALKPSTINLFHGQKGLFLSNNYSQVFDNVKLKQKSRTDLSVDI